MNENKELLMYIYQDCDMSLSSLTTLINKINNRDNKIKKTVEEVIKGYEEFLKKINKYSKKYKIDLKKNSMMSKMGATMGINMEVMKDNSDSRIADMLIQGFTLGVLNVSKKIDNYDKEVEKDIMNFAKDFKKFQQNNIELLKKYL